MSTVTESLSCSRTSIRVDLAPAGRVSFTGTVDGPEERPRLRPMLLSSDEVTARVSLVAEGALLLAGDHVSLVVEVGPGACLDLVESAGTVAYDMRGGAASWDVDVRLAAGAALVWHGEPFVVAAGADVRRRTSVVLPADARLALRETLVLGRQGEPAGSLSQHLEVVRPDGTPVLVEGLALAALTAPGLLGGHRVLGSVLGLGVPAPDDSVETLVLEGGGSLTRRLAGEAHHAVPEAAWGTITSAVRAGPVVPAC